jgi:hypothetical protein
LAKVLKEIEQSVEKASQQQTILENLDENGELIDPSLIIPEEDSSSQKPKNYDRKLGKLLDRFYSSPDALNNIPQIEGKWVENMWKNVPEKLQTSYKSLKVELEEEVVADYNEAVKQSMIDYIYSQKNNGGSDEDDDDMESADQDILKRVPKPWRSSTMRSKKAISRHLYSYNPVLAYINFIWKTVYW